AYCVTPSPSAAISPLSLHDALPIYQLGALLELHPVDVGASGEVRVLGQQVHRIHLELGGQVVQRGVAQIAGLLMVRSAPGASARSEEHTSELQSRSDLVCRLLLEKK